MNLEVEVGRRPDRRRLRADEADDVPGLHPRPVEGERRVGEVRVVELVSGAVAEPEPVAADRVQADEDELPSATASTGRAGGAKMSFPWCHPVAARAAWKSSVNEASGP